MKIRAYVNFNERTKTHYYRDFEIVDELPKLDDEYYFSYDNIGKVKAINEVLLDTEQGNDEVNDYLFYKLEIEVNNDDEVEIETEYVAIKKDF